MTTRADSFLPDAVGELYNTATSSKRRSMSSELRQAAADAPLSRTMSRAPSCRAEEGSSALGREDGYTKLEAYLDGPTGMQEFNWQAAARPAALGQGAGCG